ncbi:MAG: hypothetical protein CM1200mP41_29020 [Gammaproteobacteria bacterium]|nr:MAG: hypothetical protein CM1200mP41_29020 [Gammaproteobacteria bacterium]
MAFAQFLGASVFADAFLSLSGFLIFFVAFLRGGFSASFVPFIQKRRRWAQSRRFVVSLMFCGRLGLVLLLVTLGGIALAPGL